MTNYRESSEYRKDKLIERYEDVVFGPDKDLTSDVANNNRQIRNTVRFTVDNSGESTPFDWYNARFTVDFKMDKTADGTAIGAVDRNGMVNSASSIIKKLNVIMNGVDVMTVRKPTM